MMTCPALKPREAWAMRTDEAIRYLESRALLMEMIRGNRGAGIGGADGGETATRTGKIKHIGSMESLFKFMGKDLTAERQKQLRKNQQGEKP